MATNAETPFDALLHVIFTTALEGGIQYWATVHEYKWSQGDPAMDEDCYGFRAVISEDEEEGKTHTINRDVMLKGYELALDPAAANTVWSVSEPPAKDDLDAIEDYDFDAGDADSILQLGLFGKVVYG